MPFISQHMKQSSMLWAATRQVSTTLSLLVKLPCSYYLVVDHSLTRIPVATSGAAATIASDAFMNPFDGIPHPYNTSIMVADTHCSHQATHADSTLEQNVPIHAGLR
jgi:hypothetical protein